jgi:hypothetical protein
MTTTKVHHPRARCAALNANLSTCGIRFAEHTKVDHVFAMRAERRHHIPWPVFGQDHSYCGRRPHHYNDPLSMVWVPNDQPAAVRALARRNVLCTACFKNWMYVQHRAEFIGARGTW